MQFTLTTPCAQCPFRFDVPGYLFGSRVYEITDALFSGRVFPCQSDMAAHHASVMGE